MDKPKCITCSPTSSPSGPASSSPPTLMPADYTRYRARNLWEAKENFVVTEVLLNTSSLQRSQWVQRHVCLVCVKFWQWFDNLTHQVLWNLGKQTDFGEQLIPFEWLTKTSQQQLSHKKSEDLASGLAPALECESTACYHYLLLPARIRWFDCHQGTILTREDKFTLDNDGLAAEKKKINSDQVWHNLLIMSDGDQRGKNSNKGWINWHVRTDARGLTTRASSTI